MGHKHHSKPPNVKILFLGGGKRLSLLEHFIEAAFYEGLEPEFYCYELSPYVHIGKRATVIVGKRFDEFTVLDLDIICTRYNIDIVIPLMDAAVPVCARYKETYPHAFLPVPDYEVAQACYDKLAFIEWLKNNGLYRFYPEFKKLPGFAKSRFGYGSRDQYVITRRNQIKEGYVVQQLLDGPEYTIDCYVDQKGNLIEAVPRKRLLIVRGEVENSVTIDNKYLREASRVILEGRGFSGPITVQFMEHQGNYYLIEINARFGGGVINSIESGADYPRVLLREYLKKPIGPITYEPNVLMLRSYRETFYRNYVEK